MDESELNPHDAGPRNALREYAWFAVFLLGLALLVAIQSHG
jgi:hypothetical protein